MELLLSDPFTYLDTYLLVFVRVLGMMLIVPILSNRNVPYMTKAAFAFFLSMVIMGAVSIETSVNSTDVVNYALQVTLEFITGYTIGFGAYVVFSILSLAGQFIDMQIGFSMVNVFDPMSQIQLTITGNLYYYILMMIAIITNAHHYFIRALLYSFEAIPLGGMVISPALNAAIINYMEDFFAIALRISAPIFFVMLITNVVLGVLARAVPQLNMFVIGFPIKIIFGLVTIFVMLTSFATFSDILIGESEQQMRLIIEGMRPR